MDAKRIEELKAPSRAEVEAALQAMASSASVDMVLWDRHSNHVLSLLAEVERLTAEREEAERQLRLSVDGKKQRFFTPAFTQRIIDEQVREIDRVSKALVEQRTKRQAAEATIAALREGLEKIAGGHIPGASNFAIAGDWHSFATALQAIAKETLSTSPAPEAQND